MARTIPDMEKDKFIDGDTRTPSVRVQSSNDDNEFKVKINNSLEEVLKDILTELKKMNVYLAEMADDDLKGYENDY